MNKLTREEIVQLQAGRDIDALVAEALGFVPCNAWTYANFGAGGGPVSIKENCEHEKCYPASEDLPYGGARHYSTEDAPMMEVAREMNARGHWIYMGILSSYCFATIQNSASGEVHHATAGINELPLAVCRAFLLAMNGE